MSALAFVRFLQGPGDHRLWRKALITEPMNLGFGTRVVCWVANGRVFICQLK